MRRGTIISSPRSRARSTRWITGSLAPGSPPGTRAGIAGLDPGLFGAGVRPGLGFNVYATPGAPAGSVQVCRFFSTSFDPKSSHFYSALAIECGSLMTTVGWQFEAYVFNVMLPSVVDGSCPTGTVPVYRLFNNGQGNAPNHRFTTDL